MDKIVIELAVSQNNTNEVLELIGKLLSVLEHVGPDVKLLKCEAEDASE